jgi:hypothetical protein
MPVIVKYWPPNLGIPHFDKDSTSNASDMIKLVHAYIAQYAKH